MLTSCTNAIILTVNGDEHMLVVEPNELLINVLRNELGLTGSKYGCGTGQCGACTVLIDGEPAGAVLRVPGSGDHRGNLHVGATARATTLTPREREICQRIGPALRAEGMLFVGIDVIGDYLTEINVTSPTGLQEINRFDGVSLEQGVWDAIEARL